MMKLEDMVCSLEHAKKLREFVVKQESLFYWNAWYVSGKFRNAVLERSRMGYENSKTLSCENYSAFTASELGAMLPHFLHVNNEFIGQLSIFKHPQNFACLYGTTKRIHFIETENNLSSALAKMLIHLIENKLIEVEK